MSHEEYVESLRQDLVQTVAAVIKGEMGIILGCRKIQAYRGELVDDLDPDFLPFVGVDSETDHLPVDEERRNWSEEALARKDLEIAEAEAFYREDVLNRCRNLLTRFAIARTSK